MENHRVPSIDDFIELKLNMEKELKMNKTLKRKLNIKNLADKNSNSVNMILKNL